MIGEPIAPARNMNFIKPKAEFDLISFGEVMLRLSPPDKEKISQSEIFEKNCGGSEFNVASGAANLGIRAAVVTKLPKNKLGHFICRRIRYGTVSDDYVVWDDSEGKRLGIYYYESGVYPRKSAVVYDRAASCMFAGAVRDPRGDIRQDADVSYQLDLAGAGAKASGNGA